MTDRPASLTPAPGGYADWLAELRARIVKNMRAFAEAWPNSAIVQQAVGHLLEAAHAVT